MIQIGNLCVFLFLGGLTLQSQSLSLSYSKDSTKASFVLDDTLKESLFKQIVTHLNAPHCMGGEGPNCFDCSGLIRYAFLHISVDLPHRANAQAYYGQPVEQIEDLKRGDLVFFTNTYASKYPITHVGIVEEPPFFYHLSYKKGLILSNLLESRYWNDKFVFGKRLFNTQ